MDRLREVIDGAVDELTSLTGLELSGVVSATPREGGWAIEVEMIERRAVPDALDILGLYELAVGADGRLTAFRRKALRYRGHVGTPSADELGPEG